MARIWADQQKYEYWRRVEVAVCEAWAEQGVIPKDAIPAIRAATFDLKRIDEIFAETRHDVIAFGRYEKYNTQQRMPADYTALPQFDRSSWISGLTYKPHPDVAVKFDYVFNSNASAVTRAINGLNLGIGWWF